jgi:hypothetical protein
LKQINKYQAGACNKGAYIEIRITQRTWLDAIVALNKVTKTIKDMAKQVKSDPIEVWKHEQKRKMFVKLEKELGLAR